MEDTFDPTTTASKSDKWILNQAILNIWFNQLLPTLREWEYNRLNDDEERGVKELCSHIITLLQAIRTSLDKEFLKDKEPPYDKTRNIITYLSQHSTEENVYKVIDILEEFLYKKGLTKWDTKEVHDRTQVWKQNQRFLG